MDDSNASQPDSQCLADVASEHSGYFTNADAERCGFSRALVAYHETTGDSSASGAVSIGYVRFPHLREKT